MRIFLIGFMGCGKSTVGKKLARDLRLEFVDTDKYLSKKYDKSISQLFETLGETAFRELEKESLLELNKKNNVVIATGGGTPCYEDNLKLIQENGISIYIKMNTAALFDRLKNSKSERPLIKDLDEEQLLSFIENKLKGRIDYYQAANITVEGINLTSAVLFKEIDKYLSQK